jgi:outer membrane protein TolC
MLVSAAYGICAAILSAAENGGSGPQAEIRILTLQEAVQMTLARSPEILMAEAQAMSAGEALRENRSLNRPQLVTGTGIAYNNGFPLSIEGAAPSIFQIGASQALFSKKNANLIREAEESGKASRLGTESARSDLALKTALVYYKLYRADKILALSSEMLDEARKEQQLIETLLEAGRARPVEAIVARTATASAQQKLLEAQEQAHLADIELRELTGLSDTVILKTLEPQIDSPVLEEPEETLYNQALESTPEILQAEANVRSKEFHTEAERSERLPQMEIVSQYALFSRTNNYADYFNRFTRNNFILGLSVQLPVFNGSHTSARVARSQKEAAEAHYRLQHLKSDLKLDIERGLSALRIARGAYDFAHNDVESAREIFEMSETLFESGRISQKDLEDSRSQVQQKEMALLEADQVLFQRKLEFLRTTGAIASAIQ